MAIPVIRFGIIGCGLMGREIASAVARWCHLLDFPVRPVIVAACDTNAGALEWFKSNIPALELATTDTRALIDHPTLDAIYCAVPHHLHAPIYGDVIRAGRHLLGEKPFGIDLAATRTILDAAAERPELVVRCTSQFPFFPGVQRIVKLAREERFGRIIEVEAGFLHGSDLDPDKPINWKRMVAINGEYGCMGDLGLHVLHVPLRLGWKPKNVRAILSNIVETRPGAGGKRVPCETWDNATLLCEVDSAGGPFPMTLKTQRIAPGETNTWYVTVKGTRMSASFTTRRPRTLATMPYEPGGAQAWHVEDLGYSSVYKAITGHIFEFGFPDAIQQMFAAYCDQVRGGPDAEVPFGCVKPAEILAHHEVLTAALESQRGGRVVMVGEG